MIWDKPDVLVNVSQSGCFLVWQCSEAAGVLCAVQRFWAISYA